MAIKQLNPYLNFNGNAEEAIRFYEKTLGLRVGEITRFGDVPGMPAAPEHKSRVLHAELRLGPDGVLRSVPPSANVDPRKGQRTLPDGMQFGLTSEEIDGMKSRRQELLDRVDRGQIGTFDCSPATPSPK